MYSRVEKNGNLGTCQQSKRHVSEFYQVFYQTLNELELILYVAALQQQEAHRPSIAEIETWLTENGFQIKKTIPQTHYMRYLNGTAFLNHALVIMGFLPSWLAFFPKSEHLKIFTQLESNLNTFVQQYGELKLEVPMVYVEGK